MFNAIKTQGQTLEEPCFTEYVLVSLSWSSGVAERWTTFQYVGHFVRLTV